MDLIDKAVDAIIRSQGSDLGRLPDVFRAEGLQPPIVRLGPGPGDVPLQMHRELLAWWRAQSGPDGPPPAAAITPDVLRPYLGRLILLEPVDDGLDFRYRLYGSVIAQFTGFDLTGRLLSQTRTRPLWPELVTTYYLVTYRATYRARQACYTSVTLSSTATPYVWHRLLLPFVGPDDAVARLLLCTVPCDLDGEPLPPWRTMQD